MLTEIHPKLPMRDEFVTRDFYINKLGFAQYGGDFDGYLMVQKITFKFIFSSLRNSIRRKITDKFISEPTILMGYIKLFKIIKSASIPTEIYKLHRGGKRNFRFLTLTIICWRLDKVCEQSHYRAVEKLHC